MAIKWTLPVFGFAFGITACSSAPDPVLYTLADRNLSSAQSVGEDVIGLAELRLPAYARNQQITTAVSSHRIIEDDDHRWATPPSEALMASVSKALEGSTGRTVLKTPYPSGVRPDIRVTISFDRLLRGVNGDAEMVGQFLIQVPDSDVIIKRFDIAVATADDDYEGYMAAVTDALDELSVLIATAMGSS